MRLHIICLWFVLSFGLVSCGHDRSKSVRLTINHVVQDEALEFEKMKYNTSAGHGYDV